MARKRKTGSVNSVNSVNNVNIDELDYREFSFKNVSFVVLKIVVDRECFLDVYSVSKKVVYTLKCKPDNYIYIVNCLPSGEYTIKLKRCVKEIMLYKRNLT